MFSNGLSAGPTNPAGNNFSVSKAALIAAGGWDEGFQGYGGGEDKDLALRLAAQGLQFRFSVEALGYHHQIKGMGGRA